MKNKTIIALLVFASVGSFVSAQSSTGDVGTGNTGTGNTSTGSTLTGVLPPLSGENHSGKKENIKKNYSVIRGNWIAFHEDFGYVNRYLKRPLTGSALSGAKAIIKEKNAAIKTINKEIKSAVAGSGVIDRTGLIAKYETIYRSFATAITPYIAPAKLDSFNKFVEARIATVKKNLVLRQKNVTLKEQKYEKAEALKAKKAADLKEKQETLKKKQEELKKKQESLREKEKEQHTSSNKKGK